MDDNYCYYCQHAYISHKSLVKHIKAIHPDTHAYWNYLTDEGRGETKNDGN